MDRTALAALMTSATMLAGCGGHAVKIDPDAAPLANRWSASLSTPPQLQGAIQVTGVAWMAQRQKDTSETQVHIEVANEAPGGRHPWHVHRGQCGTDQGVLDTPDAYPVLKVGGDGKAKADAELRMPAPQAGQYYVDVHASTANMGTLVACGNMAPPAR
jgi:hypothetical protein